jgi:parallel beta-helix repeat protein
MFAVPTVSATVIHVPNHFPTIQEAVDSADEGDVIQVARGTYNENVEITTANLRLHGQNATLDGDGIGPIGIHVIDTDDVVIIGFVVEGFEAGIVLDGVEHSRVHQNELRNNLSDTTTLRDGLQLIESHFNDVTNNFSHDNGHNGITLKEGSVGNTLRNNTSNDNGIQVVLNNGGCGIQLIAADNNDNLIAENQTLRNGWGIQVGSGSNGNRVVQNHTHDNARAGVVVLDSGMANFIGQNKAQNNGLADVTPSGTFDLFDQGELDNTWRNNKGTFNF